MTSAAVTASTMSANEKDIRTLELYGVCRLSGMSPNAALALCRHPDVNSLRIYEAKVGPAAIIQILGMQQQIANANAETTKLDTASSGLRIAASTVGNLPIVGTAGSFLINALGLLASTVENAAVDSCGKPCTSDTTRRRLMGISPPSGAWVCGQMTLATWLNDGFIVDAVKNGSPGTGMDKYGRVAGVPAIGKSTTAGKRLCPQPGSGFSSNVSGYNDWLRSRARTDGLSISDAEYARRAAAARTRIVWAEYKLPCPLLMCLKNMYAFVDNALYAEREEAKRSASSSTELRNKIAALDAALDMHRRAGSRWYASIDILHQDTGEPWSTTSGWSWARMLRQLEGKYPPPTDADADAAVAAGINSAVSQANVRRIGTWDKVPTWAWVVGGLVLAGGAGYLITRKR